MRISQVLKQVNKTITNLLWKRNFIMEIIFAHSNNKTVIIKNVFVNYILNILI